MQLVFLLLGVFFAACQKQGKMDQGDDEKSIGDAGFANDYSTDEALVEIGGARAILLPLEVGNATFQITGPMLHVLQMKGLFGC